MEKKIFIFFLSIFFLATESFSDDNSGNDGVISVVPKTSISNPPTKLSAYMSAEKKIIKALKLEKKGKNEKATKLYSEALKYLYKANKIKPFDANILNYLGFVSTKFDKIEDAEIYYIMGLEIEPNHTAINEYLGELYVLTNRIDLAEERLKVLEDCNCIQYKKLKKIIDER
tara:strand:- start:144 stop:659 length:516 start_codon:yes stop_codon:yes gene_type:complete